MKRIPSDWPGQIKPSTKSKVTRNNLSLIDFSFSWPWVSRKQNTWLPWKQEIFNSYTKRARGKAFRFIDGINGSRHRFGCCPYVFIAVVSSSTEEVTGFLFLIYSFLQIHKQFLSSLFLCCQWVFWCPDAVKLLATWGTSWWYCCCAVLLWMEHPRRLW